MTSSHPDLPAGSYRYQVQKEHAGQRLDQFLAEADARFSRTLARSLINLGGVHLAGRRMRRCSHPVQAGETLEVFIDRQGPRVMTLDSERILFCDRYLMVVDKPAGMPTQPTPARFQGTLYAEVQRLLRDTLRKDLKPTIGMVQRLDRETSGVMVFSIHPQAHRQMTEQFRQHTVHKIYEALINGVPESAEGYFRSLLARRRSTNRVVSVEKGGKPAETHYRLVQAFAETSLVDVELVTGRSHQIRAHFAEANLPLLGDVHYGGPATFKDCIIPRQMLHSRALSFAHPVSGSTLQFCAPRPEDFAAVLDVCAGS
ncbi:MAG: RluA family pseudouridine synthase [Desulfuromonadales bacterium]